MSRIGLRPQQQKGVREQVTNVSAPFRRFCLTVHQNQDKVRLENEAGSENRDGDAGHVHKHRYRHTYSHATFWRAGVARTSTYKFLTHSPEASGFCAYLAL